MGTFVWIVVGDASMRASRDAVNLGNISGGSRGRDRLYFRGVRDRDTGQGNLRLNSASRSPIPPCCEALGIEASSNDDRAIISCDVAGEGVAPRRQMESSGSRLQPFEIIVGFCDRWRRLFQPRKRQIDDRILTSDIG